jgi:formate dehydrogenase subunit gamma
MNLRATDPAATPCPFDPIVIDNILVRHGPMQDQLLPALHAIQDAAGHIPPEAVGDIASAFNLSRAEVHGVITFYHYFRPQPPARHLIELCRAEACLSMGGDALLAHAAQVLGCGLHQRSADGSVALEAVYCLGHCANAPSMTIDGAGHARVTPVRFDALLAKARELA